VHKRGEKWMLCVNWKDYDEKTWEEARQLHQDVPDLINAYMNDKMAKSKRSLLQKYLQFRNGLGEGCDYAKRLTMIVCRPCCPRS